MDDERIPADMIALRSSYEDGSCYIETAELDGETNLKRRQVSDDLIPILNDKQVKLQIYL